MVPVQTTPALTIVSIRLRGNNGQWGVAHQVFRTDVAGRAGYVRMFAKLADAKRFVKGQVA